MAPELEVKPVEGTQAEKDARSVLANEKVIEALAKFVPANFTQLFQGDLAEAITKARQHVERKDIVTAQPSDVARFGRREPMAREQTAEAVRCILHASQRERYTIDKELDADGRITQALTVSTGSAGGYLLPDEFVAEVEKAEKIISVVWDLISVRKTSLHAVTKPRRATRAPSNRGTNAKAGDADSTVEIAETEATYDQITWTPRYFDAADMVKLDMLEDSPVDVMAEMVECFSDSFTEDHEEMPITGAGSGSSLPWGVLTQSGITSVAIGGAITLAKYLDFVAQLPQKYRGRATTLAGTKVVYKIIAQLAENVKAAQFLMGFLPPLKEQAYITDGKMVTGDWKRYVAYYNRLMYLTSAVVPRHFALDVSCVEKWDGLVTITDAFRIGTGVTYN